MGASRAREGLCEGWLFRWVQVCRCTIDVGRLSVRLVGEWMVFVFLELNVLGFMVFVLCLMENEVVC